MIGDYFVMIRERCLLETTKMKTKMITKREKVRRRPGREKKDSQLHISEKREN